MNFTIDRRSFLQWLQDINIEMYLTHSEGKSVEAKIFIRAIKTKFLSI